MEFTLLSDHESIRAEFCRRFVLPYGAFCHTYADWLAHLPMWFRRGYTQRYYETLPLSDRLRPEFTVLSFADSLAELRGIKGPVRFMTNGPGCMMRDHCILGAQTAYVAEVNPRELADTLEYEWFTDYELAEQGMYLANPFLPSEVYVFDPEFCRCLIFTHETDETELPETRICLQFTDK